MEYELLDTGIFNENRYFDVFIEYAKAGPEDILVKISAINRGPEAAELHLLPTLWFRNDWSAWIAGSNRALVKPNIRQINVDAGISAAMATHPLLGEFVFYCDGDVPLLFTENETNHERLFPGQKNESQHESTSTYQPSRYHRKPESLCRYLLRLVVLLSLKQDVLFSPLPIGRTQDNYRRTFQLFHCTTIV